MNRITGEGRTVGANNDGEVKGCDDGCGSTGTAGGAGKTWSVGAAWVWARPDDAVPDEITGDCCADVATCM